MGTFSCHFHQPHVSCFLGPNILLISVTVLIQVTDIAIFFYPEDRDSTFFRNICGDQRIYTASHLKRKQPCSILVHIWMGHNDKRERWTVRKMCHKQQHTKHSFAALVVPIWRLWLSSPFWCAFCTDIRIILLQDYCVENVMPSALLDRQQRFGGNYSFPLQDIFPHYATLKMEVARALEISV